jgi:folate-dependent phosphoribosylglycinamide formyltransferase PurN
VRLYLVTAEDPLYTHLVLEPLLAGGCVDIAGVTLLRARVPLWRVLSTVTTLGIRRATTAALAQCASAFFRTSVRAVLARHGVPSDLIVAEQNVNSLEHVRRLRASRADAMLVLNATQILSGHVLASFPRGVVNLHFGQLPRYRGVMPAYHALVNGESAFGVTYYLMDRRIDNGPILAQRPLPICAGDRLDDLYVKGFRAAGEMIVPLMKALAAGEARTLPNDASAATYFGQPSWRSLARYWVSTVGRRRAAAEFGLERGH